MPQDTLIQPLAPAEQEAALSTICEAFKEHPMMPPEVSHQTTQTLFRFMFKEFGSAQSACLHGSKDLEGRLECVALTLSSADEPGLWKMLCCMFYFFKILGPSLALVFLRVHASKPKRDKPYLELLLLGTSPSSQKKGLGRAMLRHLYQYAKDKGYAGITLEVAQNSPAYGFYCREGFITDKTILVKGMPLCLVHHTLD